MQEQEIEQNTEQNIESQPSQEVQPQESQFPQVVNWRRIIIFCVLAFVISGSAALYIGLQGGLDALPQVQTLIVLAVWYMAAPAMANILTRLFTGEGWHHLWLRPKLKQGWPTWVIAWFLPPLLVISGAALFFLLFPQYFDPAMGHVQALLDQAAAAGAKLPFGPLIFALIQTAQALILAPILNAIPTLGEEFGWRAYLLPELMPLGWRPALLWTGVIWGLWHWPILALGYNYGLDYAGAPWLGMIEFVGFTVLFGIILGWLTLRGGSVWPAVIGHGALNGIAALPVLFVRGDPNPLLGPLVFGLVAVIPTLAAAIWFWLHPPLRG